MAKKEKKEDLGEIRNISNVRRCGRGRYEVRWIDSEGKDKAFSSADRKKVEKRRLELVAHTVGSGKLTAPLLEIDFDGTSKSYSALLDQAVRCLVNATVEGDDISIERIKKFSEALKSISNSVLPFKNYEQLENEVEELVAYHKEVTRRAEKEDVAQLQSADQSIGSTLATSKRSKKTVSRLSDPVSN